MPHDSPLPFRILHALRIKGLATGEVISEMTMLARLDVDAQLRAFESSGWVRLREPRALWQLTPEGRVAHEAQLAADLVPVALASVAAAYRGFLGLNSAFKELCGTWQLRGDVPNDHADRAYDRRTIEQLRSLHERVQPTIAELEAALVRYAPYALRLEAALLRVEAGEQMMFTGVMCGSYHDTWMELHEDLLLTQRIDRAEEGSV